MATATKTNRTNQRIAQDDRAPDKAIRAMLASGNTSELVRLRCHIVGLQPGFLQDSCRNLTRQLLAQERKLLSTFQLPPGRRAELTAYYMNDNAKTKQLALPWRCLYNAMANAAVNYKLSGNKLSGNKTFKDTMMASIACEQDNIPLTYANHRPIRKYVVRCENGLGRALIPEWGAKFELIVDPDYYPADLADFVANILQDAGKREGVGTWGPRLKGPYGKFLVKEVRFAKTDNVEFLGQLAKEIELLQVRLTSAI